jgi:hypothetical protein
MPSFCTSCGKPLDPGAAFCASCGARAATQNAAATLAASTPTSTPSSTPAPTPTVVVQPVVQTQPVAAAPATSGGGSVLIKVILGLLLVGLLLVVTVIGAFIYGAYRVKKKADEIGLSSAIEAGAAQARSAAQAPATKRDPCSLITKEEMTEATGLQIVEASSQGGEACLYATADPTESVQLRTAWGDGKLMMFAVRNGGKLMPGGAPGTELQTVSGVGDEAYFQDGTLSARKGENAVSIMLPASLLTKGVTADGFDMTKRVAEIRDKEAAAAKKALGRM